ncbi:hypothetical protein ACFW2V_13310 [Streptomyces sp. NPDC058947]|uniref:hypothetical protein n=1 Tax=Streptomyces sp. NPDC058947 TaxID=3346675 RepID=UPI00367DE924
MTGPESEWAEDHPVLQHARRRAKEGEALLSERHPEAGEALMRLRELLRSPSGDEFDTLGIRVGSIGGQPLVVMGFLGEEAVRALMILAERWDEGGPR